MKSWPLHAELWFHVKRWIRNVWIATADTVAGRKVDVLRRQLRWARVKARLNQQTICRIVGHDYDGPYGLAISHTWECNRCPHVVEVRHPSLAYTNRLASSDWDIAPK